MESGSIKLGSSIVNGDGRPDERVASCGFVAGKDSAGEAALDLTGEVIGVFELDKGSSSSSGPFVVLRGSGARVDGLRVCFELISDGRTRTMLGNYNHFSFRSCSSLGTQIWQVIIVRSKLQMCLGPALKVAGMPVGGSCSMPTATTTPRGATIRGSILRLRNNSPQFWSRCRPMLLILLRHNL